MKVLAETPDESETHDEWQEDYLRELASLVVDDADFIGFRREDSGITLQLLDETRQIVDVYVPWAVIQPIRQNIRCGVRPDQILAPRAAA